MSDADRALVEALDDKIMPFPDQSMRAFEDALAETCDPKFSRRDVREAIRRCWRELFRHAFGGENDGK